MNILAYVEFLKSCKEIKQLHTWNIEQGRHIKLALELIGCILNALHPDSVESPN